MKTIILFLAMYVLIDHAASAASFDAVSDFSSSNPSGAWSYQVSNNGVVSTIPYYVAAPTAFADQWWTGNGIPYSAAVWANKSGSVNYWLTIQTPSGYIGMDPEAYDWVSVTFTTPYSGLYHISGNFSGIDTGEYSHAVQIVSGQSVIFSDVVNAFGSVDYFSTDITLRAGESLSFRTLTGVGSYSNLSTGLQLSVQSASTVPEPRSWLAIIFGLGLICFLPKRPNTLNLSKADGCWRQVTLGG